MQIFLCITDGVQCSDKTHRRKACFTKSVSQNDDDENNDDDDDYGDDDDDDDEKRRHMKRVKKTLPVAGTEPASLVLQSRRLSDCPILLRQRGNLQGKRH